MGRRIPFRGTTQVCRISSTLFKVITVTVRVALPTRFKLYWNFR